MTKTKQKSLLAEFMATRRSELEGGMSQKRLAEVTGVNLGTIASIESGQAKLPRRETLDRIAVGLQVNPNHLWLLATSDKLPDTDDANQLAPKAIDELIVALVKVHKVPINVANTVKMLADQLIASYDPDRENYKKKWIPRDGLNSDMSRLLEFEEFCELPPGEMEDE